MKRVHIEFQRVQTWLFTIPRLRAMVGANTLLGETLRIELPKLARQTGTWDLAPVVDTGEHPSADLQDPLNEHDDPATDACDGILARDGGHFEAQFTSGADAFAEAASMLIRRELPGLRFRVSIDDKEQHRAKMHVSTELPVLAPCEWTGCGLASAEIEQGTERPAVSLDVQQRHNAARRTENGSANDLASLLIVKTGLEKLSRAKELEELVGDGYLALIHADGNSIGTSAPKDIGALRNHFFHRNRVLLRRALVPIINEACGGEETTPLLPLMLGGDDILVVCRADKALPFVVALCRELRTLQKDDENDFKLTLGIGVVIAKHTIPIHRLHEMAEQLASSAKRRFRGFKPDKPRSVADWAVYTTTWLDDLEEVRRRDWLRGTQDELRVLSQRPLDVLGDGLDSLQGLVRGARELEAAPRSQLRYLVEELSRGRALSELAFAELSREARDGLQHANLSAEALWTTATESSYVTPLLDLVEIFEIGRLGRAANASAEHPMEGIANG